MRAVAHGPLVGLDWEIGPGCHVVLGAPSDGTAALVELVAGVVLPQRGSVVVGSGSPAMEPAVRSRVGSLLPAEELPPAKDVAHAIELAVRARGTTETAAAILNALGIGSWASRPVRSLDVEERRSVGLALALSHAAAGVLVLFEPARAAHAAGAAGDLVTRALRARAQDGTCVLVATGSPRDAAAFGGAAVLLDRGRPIPEPSEGAVVGGMAGLVGEAPTFALRSEDAGTLARVLAGADGVLWVTWDARTPSELVVRASDLDRAALSIARATHDSKVVLEALSPSFSSLESVRAVASASVDGARRAAYEAAYERARRAVAPGEAAS